MNQIPNIEEAVSLIVEMKVHGDAELEEDVRTVLHQELQKAREEERERCFQKICSVRGDIRDKALFEATEMFIEAFDFLDVNKDSL